MKKIFLNLLFLLSVSLLFAQQPVVTYCGKTGGDLTVGQARCGSRLVAVVGTDTVPILSFEMTTTSRGTATSGKAHGDYLSCHQRSLQISVGGNLYFDNIIVLVDDKKVKVPSLSFKIVKKE